MGLEVGLYSATVEKEGYQSLEADFRVKLGKPRESEFVMEKLQVTEMTFVTKIGDFEITPEVKGKFQEAQTAFNGGNHGEAKTLFEEITGMMPELPEPYKFLFAIYKKEGQKAKALENIQAFIEREPDDASARMECAYLLEDEGKADEAQSHYQKVLELEPGTAGAHKQLGLLLLKQGKFKECQTHLNKYLELSPEAKDTAFIKDVLKGLEPYLAGGCN
jgi:tetratricopeptide (TPR) repeat protein